MNKKRRSIDGFVPRRAANSQPSISSEPGKKRQKKPQDSKKAEKQQKENEKIERALQNLYIDDDIGDSDSTSDDKNRKIKLKLDKFNKRREKKGKRALTLKQYKIRKGIKKCIIIVALILLVLFGFKFSKSLISLTKVFKGGNVFDLIKKDQLKKDSDGRTNILIFGTSPEGWDGEDLADSIMVVSVNQETKKAYTVSLPRDLWVKHKCTGWLGTSAGKLNESYGCGKLGQGKGASKDEAEKLGQDELKNTAQKVLGLDIQYVVHGNWQVLIGAIDAIGGIDVTIEVYDGSPEMYDAATKVRYKNGQRVHMNGEQALAFSRARGSHGGYGLSGGNFDRERNQQKIIKATLEKINSSAKYNPSMIMDIMTTLGNNIKTTFQASEIQSAIDIAKEFKPENMKSLPFVDIDKGDNLMTTGNIAGASVVYPSAGVFDYSKIQAYIAKNTGKDSAAVSENAKIVILNGTNISGLAAEQKTKLTKDGYNVIAVDSAPKTNYKSNKVYIVSDNTPQTAKSLAKIYNTSEEKLPDNLKPFSENADIIVVVGDE